MPRAGLTPTVVAEAAAVIADDVGYDRLTLAAVAERCGVRLPSLYKHVDGLDGLRRELALLALRELYEALTRAAMGRSGREALHAVAASYRAWARAHPGRYVATLRAPARGDRAYAAAGEAAVGVVAAVLLGYHVNDPDDVTDATRMLRSLLHGFVTLEAAGGFGRPRALDRSFDRMVTALDVAFAGWATSTTMNETPVASGRKG